jgi:hypothetical protein
MKIWLAGEAASHREDVLWSIGARNRLFSFHEKQYLTRYVRMVKDERLFQYSGHGEGREKKSIDKSV